MEENRSPGKVKSNTERFETTDKAAKQSQAQAPKFHRTEGRDKRHFLVLTLP